MMSGNLQTGAYLSFSLIASVESAVALKMRLFFKVVSGHTSQGNFDESSNPVSCEWDGTSLNVLLNEVKRIYPLLNPLTAFFVTGNLIMIFLNIILCA